MNNLAKLAILPYLNACMLSTVQRGIILPSLTVLT